MTSVTRRSGTPRTREGKSDVAQDEWSVSCRDLAGRKSDLTVFVNSGRVIVVAPPGDAAVLAPLDVGRLRAALREAVVAAGRQDER